MSEGEELDEVVAALRARFRAQLGTLAASMREALATLGGDAASPATRHEAARTLLAGAHRLAGSAGSFGLSALGDAAGLVEETLRGALDAAGAFIAPPPLARQVQDLLALCAREGK